MKGDAKRLASSFLSRRQLIIVARGGDQFSITTQLPAIQLMSQNFSYRKQVISWESEVKTPVDRSFYASARAKWKQMSSGQPRPRSGPFEARLDARQPPISERFLHGSRALTPDTFLVSLLSSRFFLSTLHGARLTESLVPSPQAP